MIKDKDGKGWRWLRIRMIKDKDNKGWIWWGKKKDKEDIKE